MVVAGFQSNREDFEVRLLNFILFLLLGLRSDDHAQSLDSQAFLQVNEWLQSSTSFVLVQFLPSNDNLTEPHPRELGSVN